MRFGKRNRNPLLRGRLSKKAGQDSSESLATEERDALLSTESDIDPSVIESTGHEGTAGTESTQRLLTVLGRFQRQVARAKDGAPQEQWSDECMNQLIAAVEIALREDWKDVAEVLTETGRVLQSYEDGGEAQCALPFLSDSYDMLCLMVGDLMVGAVRPGVLKRWRQRYQRAISEIEQAGLTLVRDEDSAGESITAAEPQKPKAQTPPVKEEDSAGESTTAAKPQKPKAQTPPVKEPDPAEEESAASDAETPFEWAEDDEDAEDQFIDSPSFAPLESGTNGGGDATPPPFEPAEPNAADEAASSDDGEEGEGMFAFNMSGLFGATRQHTSETDEADDDSVAPPWNGVQNEQNTEAPEDSVQPPPPFEVDSQPDADEDSEDEAGGAPSITEQLDAFCETLAYVERCAENERAAAAEALFKQTVALDEAAQWDERPGAVAACETCLELLEILDAHGGDDRLYELLYGFCGAYMEAGESLDDSTLVNWRNECKAYFAGESAVVSAETGSETAAPRILDFVELRWEQESGAPDVSEPLPEQMQIAPDSALEMPPEPLAPVEPESEAALPKVHLHAALTSKDYDSPHELLQIAMRAISQGEGENAKLLTLRAAAGLAKSEAARAEAELGRSERRLREEGAAIEKARDIITEAERAVEEAEIAVAEGQEALSTREQEEQAVAQRVEAVQTRISEIDEQIRRLQEQRAEAVQEQEAAEEDLDEAQRRKEAQEAHIHTMAAEEQAAREQLEDARRKVHELQRRHSETESAMEKAREILMRQRGSLRDIEETIEQVQGGEQSGESGWEEPGMLF